MIINNLKKAVLLSTILLIGLTTIIYVKQIEIKNDLSGSLISDNLIYNFPKADSIILSNEQNKIELVKIDENWKIKDNFYIDENIIDIIFQNISENKLVMKIDDITNYKKANIIISNQGKKLYNLEFYQNGENSLIKPENNNFYWLLSKKINLPKLKKSEFYKQPLYTSDIKEIKEFTLLSDDVNISFYRENYGDKFKLNSDNLNDINSTLFAIFAHKITNINYTDVINIKSLDYLITSSRFNITSYDGIILNIKLYQKENNHFVTIDAKLDRIHKNQAIKKVEEINSRYNNWLFKINSNDAKILNSQILLHQNISNAGG